MAHDRDIREEGIIRYTSNCSRNRVVGREWLQFSKLINNVEVMLAHGKKDKDEFDYFA